MMAKPTILTAKEYFCCSSPQFLCRICEALRHKIDGLVRLVLVWLNRYNVRVKFPYLWLIWERVLKKWTTLNVKHIHHKKQQSNSFDKLHQPPARRKTTAVLPHTLWSSLLAYTVQTPPWTNTAEKHTQNKHIQSF